MGGRGGGSPGGAGNWRADVEDNRVKLDRSSGAQSFIGDEDTWPRPHLLANAAEQTRLENLLREVYRTLSVGKTEGWVRLPAIRDALAKRGLNRARQDSALLGIATKRDAQVINIANLKSLSNDDRRAAILLGGEFNHAIRIGF